MPSFFQTLLFALILNMPLVAFAHDMLNQDSDTVKNTHDLGYVRSKMLAITWQPVTDPHDNINPYNPILGTNIKNNVKHDFSFEFMVDVIQLYEDGVLSGLSAEDFENGEKKGADKILKNLSNMGSYISELEGKIALLEKRENRTSKNILKTKNINLKSEFPGKNKKLQSMFIIRDGSDSFHNFFDPFYEFFDPFNDIFNSSSYLNFFKEHCAKVDVFDYSFLSKLEIWYVKDAIYYSLGFIDEEKRVDAYDKTPTFKKDCQQNDQSRREWAFKKNPVLRKAYIQRLQVFHSQFGYNAYFEREPHVNPFVFYRWTLDMELLTPRAFQEAFSKLNK